MKRIYLSGPMTGLPEFNFPAFHAAAAKIRAHGHDVFNPAESVVDASGTWEEFMRHDLKALCDCDTIAILPGWATSRGAHLEVYVAHQLGIAVVDASIFDGSAVQCEAA